MKTSIVPAQITTIEDKIAGNLSLTQMVLLLVPVFLFGLIFIILPPFERLTTLKLILSVVFAIACIVSAIRIDGKIILSWCIVLLRYNTRPQFYIFDKNDMTHRDLESLVFERDTPSESLKTVEHRSFNFPLSFKNRVAMELMISDPDSRVVFRPGKKGGVHVRIAEIKS